MYWLPPPLAAPNKSRKFRFPDLGVDYAASWFWKKRLSVYKQGDPYTFTPKELNTILTYKDYDRRSAYSKRAYSSLYGYIYKTLDVIQLDETFSLVEVPIENDYIAKHPNNRYFLILRKEEEKISFYPRSLLYEKTRGSAQQISKRFMMSKTAPLWHASFDALPKWASNFDEKMAGFPFLANSMPKTEKDETPESQAYKKNIALATAALFALYNIPSQSTNKHFEYLRLTLFSPRYSGPEKDCCYKEGFFRAEVDQSDWKKNLDPQHAASVQKLERIILAMAQDIPPPGPFFFDTLNNSLLAPSEWKEQNWVGTGQHFCWLHGDELPSIISKHDAFHILSTLPEEWMNLFFKYYENENQKNP